MLSLVPIFFIFSKLFQLNPENTSLTERQTPGHQLTFSAPLVICPLPNLHRIETTRCQKLDIDYSISDELDANEFDADDLDAEII